METVTLKFKTSFDGEVEEKTLPKREYISILLKAVARIRKENPERLSPHNQTYDSSLYADEFRTLFAPASSPHQFSLREPFVSACAKNDWVAIKIQYGTRGYEWVFALMCDDIFVPVPTPALLSVDSDGSISGHEIWFPRNDGHGHNNFWPLIIFEPEKYALLGRIWHLLTKDKDNPLTWIFRKDEALASILAAQLGRIEVCARRVLAVE